MTNRKPEWSLLAPLRSLMVGVADGELAPNPQALEEPTLVSKYEPLEVTRSFAFVDLSGFTTFCDRYGEQRAIEVLAAFRQTTRTVSARRGVRVAKWLGDGVMLVGLDPAALAATVGEIVLRNEASRLGTHAGVATGEVLLFEGDDYVGRPVNLAARLCDRAGPNEVLVAGSVEGIPPWLALSQAELVEVKGVDALVDVRLLEVAEHLRETFDASRVA